MTMNEAPLSSKELLVRDQDLGTYHRGHFQLNDDFYRQQLGVPVQVSRSLVGADPAPGRAHLVNEALPDTGPSRDLARPWATSALQREVPPNERVAPERFFEPTVHRNDEKYALANSYMPPPAVQYYGKANEEDYPIWGMNGVALSYLSGYPQQGARSWRTDGHRAVPDTSSELENRRRVGSKPAQLGTGYRASASDVARAHMGVRLSQAPGEDTRPGQPAEKEEQGRLPGGRRADELSLSYHTVGGGLHESPYLWSEAALVHNSLLDIRKGPAVRSNALRKPPLPFTPFNLPGHTDAQGNV